jgi:preprotein translocase subunit SecG
LEEEENGVKVVIVVFSTTFFFMILVFKLLPRHTEREKEIKREGEKEKES